MNQSDRTGKLWEMGLYDKCEELEEKYGVHVPITEKLKDRGREVAHNENNPCAETLPQK